MYGYVHMSAGSRGILSPHAAITGGCKPPNVGDRNQTLSSAGAGGSLAAKPSLQLPC